MSNRLHLFLMRKMQELCPRETEDLLPGILHDLQADRPSVITLLNNAKHVGHTFLRESQGF